MKTRSMIVVVAVAIVGCLSCAQQPAKKTIIKEEINKVLSSDKPEIDITKESNVIDYSSYLLYADGKEAYEEELQQQKNNIAGLALVGDLLSDDMEEMADYIEDFYSNDTMYQNREEIKKLCPNRDFNMDDVTIITKGIFGDSDLDIVEIVFYDVNEDYRVGVDDLLTITDIVEVNTNKDCDIKTVVETVESDYSVDNLRRMKNNIDSCDEEYNYTEEGVDSKYFTRVNYYHILENVLEGDISSNAITLTKCSINYITEEHLDRVVASVYDNVELTKNELYKYDVDENNLVNNDDLLLMNDMYRLATYKYYLDAELCDAKNVTELDIEYLSNILYDHDYIISIDDLKRYDTYPDGVINDIDVSEINEMFCERYGEYDINYNHDYASHQYNKENISHEVITYLDDYLRNGGDLDLYSYDINRNTVIDKDDLELMKDMYYEMYGIEYSYNSNAGEILHQQQEDYEEQLHVATTIYTEKSLAMITNHINGTKFMSEFNADFLDVVPDGVIDEFDFKYIENELIYVYGSVNMNAYESELIQ